MEYVLMSLKITSKFNIPGKTTTWNASTWLSRWGELIWTTFLDWGRLVWPGTASWPLVKDHSGHTEVLKMSKLWPGFKISPILADLCHLVSEYLNSNAVAGKSLATPGVSISFEGTNKTLAGKWEAIFYTALKRCYQFWSTIETIALMTSLK